MVVLPTPRVGPRGDWKMTASQGGIVSIFSSLDSESESAFRLAVVLPTALSVARGDL